MPAVRMYTVVETREVEVRAEDPADAVRAANVLFRDSKVAEESPHRIKVTDISAREF